MWRASLPLEKGVQVERLVYGFKELMVYEVRLRLVAAAEVVPINGHELKCGLVLVARR